LKFIQALSFPQFLSQADSVSYSADGQKAVHIILCIYLHNRQTERKPNTQISLYYEQS